MQSYSLGRSQTNAGSSNSINILYQNITELRNKNDELIRSLKIDNVSLHMLFLSDHHKVEHELLHLTITCYLLGSNLSHKGLQRGGVCIFVKTNQHFRKNLCFSSLEGAQF